MSIAKNEQFSTAVYLGKAPLAHSMKQRFQKQKSQLTAGFFKGQNRLSAYLVFSLGNGC